MNTFISLILLVALFNISFALLPPSPGPIQHDQYVLVPVASYYGFANKLGLIPLSSNCDNYFQVYSGVYNPIVILNETALLASQFSIEDRLSMVIITPEGVEELEIPSSLSSLIENNTPQSHIYYDDRLNMYLYINRNNQIVYYDITDGSSGTDGVKNVIATGSQQYYDLTTSTLYTPFIFNDNGTQYQMFSTYQTQSAAFTKFTVYELENFNLEVEIESVKISGYQDYAIVFGINIDTQKSYLYQLDLSSKSSVLLSTAEFGTTFITGVNPRYVLLVSANKTSMQLFDLQLNTSSETFQNTCAQSSFTSAFLSSIALKNIFVN